MFVSSIPVLTWMWLRSFSQRWRGVREPLPRGVVGVAVGVAVVLVAVFWVVRNLPFGSWLAP